MRKVFIDLGAGSGGDIAGYYSLDDDNKNHEVFAFEANPVRVSGIKRRYPDANVLNKAVGVEDTVSKMYLGGSLNTSSLNENKVSISTSNYIEVEVLHFTKWLAKNFTADDYITLAIDIEGSEYELLEDMLTEDQWGWIDQLYVEFHGTKLADFDIKIENDLVEKLIDFYGDRVYIYRKHQHQEFLKLNPEGE